MTDRLSAYLALAAEDRLGPLLFSQAPAFLFVRDGSRILFANPAAARLLGARSFDDLAQRGFAGHPLGRQVAALAPSLGEGAAPRMHMVRLSAGFRMEALACAVQRFRLGNGTSAVLLAASSAAVSSGDFAAQQLSHLFPGRRFSFSATGEGVAITTPHGIRHLTIDGAAEPAARPVTAAGEPAAAAEQAPTRFAWQTDAEGRFTFLSREFALMTGLDPETLLGLDLLEVAARHPVEGLPVLTAAFESRDTWSGVALVWQTREGRVQAELAALPVFGSGHAFEGYRGFGTLRPLRPEPSAQAADTAPAEASNEVPDRRKAPRERSSVRPQLVSIGEPSAPAARKILAFRSDRAHLREADPSVDRRLAEHERDAFREIAKALGARLPGSPAKQEAGAEPALPGPASVQPPAESVAQDAPSSARAEEAGAAELLIERLPVATIVSRDGALLHVNLAGLDLLGYPSVEALEAAGGLSAVFASDPAFEAEDYGGAVLACTAAGDTIEVEARLFTGPWRGARAVMLSLQPADPARARLAAEQAAGDELRAILDTATDGVVVLTGDGRIESANRSAQALFGYEAEDLRGQPFTMLIAEASRRAALDYLDGLMRNGVASVLNDGREVMGRVRQGGDIALFLTIGRLGEADARKFCAVLRDISQWKHAEEDLTQAKRQAEKVSSQKSDFLAKISHEIRTPLNAILGFSEVILEERFGPIANERYRSYLRDIHTSGAHVISLVDDLLDLSKIEAGKLDLDFTGVAINELVQQSVGMVQPQAARERIIIRTSLAANVPQVVADQRSLRQIVLNLLSNSIRFTKPGGQVIVSTALSETGEIVLRVRDTGIGMTPEQVAMALEPFRQIEAPSNLGNGGTGLGLPLTKALVEANRATFTIDSRQGSGTLVEVAFPPTRVLAG